LEIKGENIGSLQREGPSEGTVVFFEFYINITQTFKSYPLKNSGKEMGSLFFLDILKMSGFSKPGGKCWQKVILLGNDLNTKKIILNLLA
jgi:hypothetical protein